jgi:transmembrane sensor
MDKLMHELEEAREGLAPLWDEERSARLYAGTLQRKRRRAVQRGAAVSVSALCAVVAFAVVFDREPIEPAVAAPSVGHTLRLADGSSAQLVGTRSELEVTHNSAQRVALKLLSGRAHFDVVPNTQRSFVVEVDPYRVEVIGTIFDVEREAGQLSVQVTRGKVRVYGPSGARDVAAGQLERFVLGSAPSAPTPAAGAPSGEAGSDVPALEGEGEPVEADEPSQPSQPTRARARHGRRNTSGMPSWRSLSQSGQYEAAFESLRRGEAVEDDAAALMDAADAARLSEHPANAVQYLERVVSRHAQSPVAPLAAFTLGRVYLDKLGQPERAAQAFETARLLAPAGSLAQDALAREVEALSKGGNAQKASIRAQEYLERYPNGRRVRAVQLYGSMK